MNAEKEYNPLLNNHHQTYDDVISPQHEVSPRHPAARVVSDCSDYFVPPFDSPNRKSSQWQATFNIISTLLDGTALSLPYAFSKCGIFLSNILLIVIAILSYITVTAIITLSRKLSAASLSEIVEKCLGSWCRRFLTFNLLIVLMGTLIGFEILLSSISKDILLYFRPQAELGTFQVEFFLVTFLITFPLTLVDSLHSLRYTCYCGFFAIVSTMLSLLFKFLSSDIDVTICPYLYNIDFNGFMAGFSIICLVYLCHFNVLGVYTQVIHISQLTTPTNSTNSIFQSPDIPICTKQLKHPSDDNIHSVIQNALVIITVIYSVLGTAGAFLIPQDLYGSEPDNILSIFSHKDDVALLARLSVLVTLICAVPVIIVPTRTIFLVEVFGSLHLHRYLYCIPNLAKLDSVVGCVNLSGENRSSLIVANDLEPASRLRATSDGDIISHFLHYRMKSESSSTADLLEPQFLSSGDQSEPIANIPMHPPAMSPNSYHITKEEISDVDVGMDGLEASWREWRVEIDPGYNLEEEKAYQTDFENHLMLELHQIHFNSPTIDRKSPIDFAAECPKLSSSFQSLSGISSPIGTESLFSSSTDSVNEDYVLPVIDGMYIFKVVLTFCIFILTMLPAIAIPAVSTVWTIIGSIITPVIAFIIPSSCYCAFIKARGLQVDSLMIICGLFLVVFSCSTCFGIFNTINFVY